MAVPAGLVHGAALAPLVLIAMALSVCSAPDREVQLRDTIRSMAAALEAHEPGPFLRHVAEDFSGGRGAWDEQRVRRFVLGQTLRKEPLAIGLNRIEITMHGERAGAVVTARITGERGWIPARGETYRFDTGWRLDGGRWKVIRADWERVD